MKLSEENRDAWARELQQHRLQYPDEPVVRFLAHHRPTRAGAQGLDVGFGSGRHLGALAQFGFRACGIELIDDAPAIARSLYPDLELGDLVIADVNDHPFPANTFDVVILNGTAFLKPIDAMRDDLTCVASMMRPGGSLLVNFRARENWFYGLGERIDGETFRLDARAGAFEGMDYTFCDQATAQTLLEDVGFAIENVERLEQWRDHLTRRHAWWNFWARKP